MSLPYTLLFKAQTICVISVLTMFSSCNKSSSAPVKEIAPKQVQKK